MGVQEQEMMGGVLCVRLFQAPVTQAKGFTGCRVFQSRGLTWQPGHRPSNCATGRGTVGR